MNYRDLIWDEENRLKAIAVNNRTHFQHYIYDHIGQRGLKGRGNRYTLDKDGEIVIDEIRVKPYVVYAGGHYVVAPNGRYTKHYFRGASRFASRLGGRQNASGTNSLSTLRTLQNQERNNTFRSIAGFVSIVNEPDSYNGYPNGCNNSHVGLAYYIHGDHLGSAHFTTDGGGNPYEFNLYLPYAHGMGQRAP